MLAPSAVDAALKILERAGCEHIVIACVDADGRTQLRSARPIGSTPALRREVRGRLRRRLVDLVSIGHWDAFYRGRTRRG